ncbi:MAG: galactose-1-phosphate uridylyltransferase [Nitrospirae bacterium]|nr:MAG: galactose-1-phosphate uridylyltransferase [Nitrospirota bacterium]
MTRTDLNELRKDPLLGRWVAVLGKSKTPAEYQLPPHEQPETSCILCQGRESEAPGEIMSLRAPGSDAAAKKWSTRVIPNFAPIFQVEGDLGRRGDGMYDKMNSIGANEIIIESPEHNSSPEDMGLDQMTRVITTYRERMSDLEKDPRLRYTLIYKNAGRDAGAVFSHPISHLASTPVIPKRVKEELDGAKQYFAYKERCLFCDLIREEMRVGSRVILETRHFLAFCPYASKFPFEIWILPKQHQCAFQDIRPEETEDMALMLSSVLKKLKTLFPGLSFNYFIHSAPNRVPRKDHWHTLGEDFHWHLEIMPRFLKTSGFEWGSGFYILPTSPEDASKYLREV